MEIITETSIVIGENTNCSVNPFSTLIAFIPLMVDVAQLVRAPDCGSGGRRFDSDHPPFLKFLYWGIAKR